MVESLGGIAKCTGFEEAIAVDAARAGFTGVVIANRAGAELAADCRALGGRPAGRTCSAFAACTQRAETGLACGLGALIELTEVPTQIFAPHHARTVVGG